MRVFLRRMALGAYSWLYQRHVRPRLFADYTAQEAHQRALDVLGWLDERPLLHPLLSAARWLTAPPEPVEVGGVHLTSPLLLAAGLIKGEGFATEEDACRAVEAGRDIIPGWQSLPRLVGPLEIGSFTRYPRLGNPGTVLWRDPATRSTQNRVGLRNPGVRAAAAFLSQRPLSPQTGLNIAVSPGVDDPAQAQSEILEALNIFLDAGVTPAWFTLNLSCPNTEDDPAGQQTASQVYNLCGAARERLAPAGIPLWVKIGPDLGTAQYTQLLAALAEVGVQAVIATNTLARPAPDGPPDVLAGIGGGRLHPHALAAVSQLAAEKARHGYPLDIIGCGGVLDAASYQAHIEAGAQAVQYWSALVYLGPLAAALICHQLEQNPDAS